MKIEVVSKPPVSQRRAKPFNLSTLKEGMMKDLKARLREIYSFFASATPYERKFVWDGILLIERGKPSPNQVAELVRHEITSWMVGHTSLDIEELELAICEVIWTRYMYGVWTDWEE